MGGQTEASPYAVEKAEPLLTSVLTGSALVRLGLAVSALSFLWLAVIWAVSLP